MGSPAIEVFRADAEDAIGIAQVHVAAFSAAFSKLPGVAGTEPSLDDRISRWERLLEDTGRDDSPQETLVAELRGEIVGFCTMTGPARDAEPGEAVAEIGAFYVDPTRWRRGVGNALLTKALASLKEAGWAAVTLWVLVENEPARTFYARYGFASDGAAGPDALTQRPKMRLRASLA